MSHEGARPTPTPANPARLVGVSPTSHRHGSAGDDVADEGDAEDVWTTVERVRWQGTSSTRAFDTVAREEPLEIRIGGIPLAVLMRTPGHDEDLVRGFLVTEGIVASQRCIARMSPCTNVDGEDAEGNVMQVRLTADSDVDVQHFRRNLYATSSCGLCGKATIERVMAIAPPIDSSIRVRAETIYTLPDTLRRAQSLFERTGGCHAAGLFDAVGNLSVAREDIGRHNAVDKTIGWFQNHPHREPPAILLVSGRVSFEIVQKTLAARVPILAAVSAPSSLAVQLARTARLTLVAFVRGRSLQVYAGGERVTAG